MTISTRRQASAQRSQLRQTILVPAALVTCAAGSRVAVSLPRLPGVVDLARAVAEEVGVAISAEIVANGIAIVFSPAP